MINLREIEHEYDPAGNFGRGVLVPKSEVDLIDPDGYRLVFVDENGPDFRIHGVDGSPSTLRWRGFVREEDGKHYCAAVEYYDR